MQKVGRAIGRGRKSVEGELFAASCRERTKKPTPSYTPHLRSILHAPGRLSVLLDLCLSDPCSPASKVSVLVPESVREWFRCTIMRPLLRQLRGGVTPRRLAWSLAFGVIIGINPSIGLTTLVVITLAWIFGLNQIASQLGSHVVAPLHLLLFLPFIQLGVYLFHTRRLPLSRQQIEHLSHHPVRLFRSIWQWEWHALVVWGLVAVIAMPLLAIFLRRLLVLTMRRHRTLLRSRPAVH
jgi:uncharacterized protein (DUF2062 family)